MKLNFTPSREQMRYADILFYGCWIGLCILFVTYFLYVTALVPAHIPLSEMPQYWSLPASHYLQAADVPIGWGWTRLIGQGDFMNFIGIVFLAGLSIVCYLSIIPSLISRKRYMMSAIACLEVLVLVLAASGILTVGAH